MKHHLVGETRAQARALLIRMTLPFPGRRHGLGPVRAECCRHAL